MFESLIYKNRFTDLKQKNKIWEIITKNYFQNFINYNDIVLDIPCGNCEFINNINCRKKIAIDINKDSKKYIGKNLVFKCNSSTKIKLNNKSVNKIFVSNFFEHISRPDIIKTIKEFHRILKERGEVLVLQPNIRFCKDSYWMFFDHITPIDDRALEEIFSIFGFKLKYRVLKFLPFSTKSSLPKNNFIVKLYLKLPILWKLFGKQSFLIFKK